MSRDTEKKWQRGHAPPEAYTVNEVSVKHVRNRNEMRVIALLPVVLEEFVGYHPDSLDIEDIYALALNSLPARYVQSTSIILSEPVSDEDIASEIRKAIRIVEENPKH